MSPLPLLRATRRVVANARGMAVVVIGTIALGAGALTTAFGVVDAALWRPPPFRGADRLVLVFTTHTSARDPLHNERWSYPRIRALRQRARSLQDVANFTPTALSLTGTELTEPVRGEVVSHEYFRALSAATVRGRVFDAEEDRVPGAHPVVVLGYDLWQRRFGGSDSTVGRAIGLNGQSLTVIGIMQPGFRGLSNEAQLWVPTTMAPLLSYAEYLTTDQNFIGVVARLGDGASLESVRAELATLGPSIYREIPDANPVPTARVGATALRLNEARVTLELRRGVLLLLGAIGLLHLLACANVTSLLLGRAVSRRREAAIRSALGSGPRELFLRFFGEAALLCGLGGAGGLVIASWASTIVVPLNAWGPRNFYGSLASFSEPDFGWRSIVFGSILTLMSAVLVSWAPAVSATRVDLSGGLRDAARGSSSGWMSLRRASARGAIVALESALAAMLLVAGGLMIDSFRRMRGTDLGVDVDAVLTFTLQPSEVRVPVSRAPEFIERVLQSIAATPGVVSASVDGGAPLSGSASSTLYIVGRPAPPLGAAPPILRHYVAPAHFSTLGIPLVRGRAFSDRDRAGQPKVVVISETAARTFWPSSDPIGERVWFGGGSSFSHPDSSAEIVGVVGDVFYQPLDRAQNAASFYTPYQQFTYAWRTYFVRTVGDPAAMVPAIREAVHRVDPDVPLTEVRTLTDLVGASWRRHRFDAFFFGGFAALALLLAATGIYAVVSQAVSQRTREMGIRLALGAREAQVRRLVVREGLAFPVVGLAVGLAASLALAGILRSSLYGVAPTEPRIFAATAGVLFVVAAAACALPAHRATRVDPNEALRSE